jgi:hypothetical protein
MSDSRPGWRRKKKRSIENFCQFICIELFQGTSSKTEQGYLGVENKAQKRKRQIVKGNWFLEIQFGDVAT